MLKELLKYFMSFVLPRAGSCELTVVRRYKTATGWVGELYLDGRQLGMTCDALSFGEEMFKHPLKLGFESSQRMLRTDLYAITRGDFTSKVPFNYCYVGSQEPAENDVILRRLIDLCAGFKYIRLTVINRPLVEWEN